MTVQFRPFPAILRWSFLLSIALCVCTQAAPQRRFEGESSRTNLRLEKTVEELLSQPSVASAHWGISVVSLGGKSIYAFHDGQYFNPASNAKLFTTAAAFALLPANLTFTTLAAAQGKIDPSGKLEGDLVLLGAGDPDISGRALPFDGKTERSDSPLAALDSMADEIIRRGIHSISGDVVGDDTWFPYERYPSGWGWDDLQWSYGAPISALTVNDNVVYLNALPASQAGETAVASWVPATSYYTLENSLITLSGVAPQTGIERQPGSLSVRLYGQVPLGGDGVHAALAIEDPADYAARSLREMLMARGVEVGGRARAQHRFSSDTEDFFSQQKRPLALHRIALATVENELSGATVLASHVSPPLAEDLVVTNKVSQNLHAELLLRTLGKQEGADGSLVEGTRVVRQFLIEAGVDPDDFVLYDGSGLSPLDLTTPRAFTDVLLYAARQSWGAAFRSTLPIGGEDGTLAGRFRTPALRGKVFAKTGTLSESSALSGYVTAASGQTLAFSILCSDHARGDQVLSTMDKIVAAIARMN